MKNFLENMFLQYLSTKAVDCENERFFKKAEQLSQDFKMKLSEEECLALDELIGYCFQQNYGQMKKVFFDGFKKGFELSNELENFLK